MARLIDLTDRTITDSGRVVANYELLQGMALLGKELQRFDTVDHPDVRKYNKRNPKREIPIVEISDEIMGPPASSFEWTIPEKYQNLDVVSHVGNRLALYTEQGKIPQSDAYEERVATELHLMEQRGMFPFLRCLIYIRDVIEQNKRVLGVGRGSSCASLVLFLLGVNRVDPILYEIPIEEFLR